LYSSPNTLVIRVSKSRRIRWTWRVARFREVRKWENTKRRDLAIGRSIILEFILQK